MVFGVLEWRWYSWGKVVVVEVLSVQMDCCGMRQNVNHFVNVIHIVMPDYRSTQKSAGNQSLEEVVTLNVSW